MIKIYLEKDRIIYDPINKTFNNNSISFDEVVKYLKGKYSTKELFLRDFCRKNNQKKPRLDLTKSKLTSDLVDKILNIYDDVTPFTYKEAFDVNNEAFRALVFETIDVSEMMKHLGSRKIKTDGIEVDRKIFDHNGNFLRMEKKHNIYEIYEIDCDALGLNNQVMYAVKCWCTTTNNEHWIWIEDEYADEPLTAIASTFRIYEGLIPHIKEIKRQGDILIVEMLESGYDLKEEDLGNIIPLTKEQYFNLLTCET